MRVWFFIVLLFFCGCGNAPYYVPSEKEEFCNKVTRIAAKQICNATGLVPCGSGGGAMDQVRMLALSFNYGQEVNITEGRKLLISALDTFQAVINSDEEIRPYLIKYPFEPKNIEIRIFIQNPDGRPIGLDALCVISAIDGILEYEIHTPDGMWLDTVYQETYEEALKKMKETHV